MKIEKLLLLLSLFLSSCCKVPYVNYTVKNDTEYPIVVVRTVSSNYIVKNPTDTFIVASGEDTVLAIRTGAITGAANYKIERIMEHGETLQVIETLHIYNNDSIKSPANFLLTSRWAFEELNSFVGNYTLTVSNTDF